MPFSPLCAVICNFNVWHLRPVFEIVCFHGSEDSDSELQGSDAV
jgi:hypothetical protein